MRRTLAERFWANVEKHDGDCPCCSGCWIWAGYISAKGYGRMRTQSGPQQTIGAHRVAYELLVGPIPEGLTIDHLCRNRGCVNPEHLEVVTQRENTRRGKSPAGVNAQKTHCDRCGSELAQLNRRQRGCLPCRRIGNRKRMRRYTLEKRPYTVKKPPTQSVVLP